MPSTIDRRILRRVKRIDRAARGVIVAGGTAVILAVVLILVLIVGKALPLFLPAGAVLSARAELPLLKPEEVRAVGVASDSGREGAATAYVLGPDGDCAFVEVSASEGAGAVRHQRIAPPGGAKDARIVSADGFNGSSSTWWSLAWSDGASSLVEVWSKPTFGGGRRAVKFTVSERAAAPAADGPPPRLSLLRRQKDGTPVRAVVLADNRLAVDRVTKSTDLLGQEKLEIDRRFFNGKPPGRITAIAMDHHGESLYAGTGNGWLIVWPWDSGKPEVVRAFDDHRPITSLALLLGEVSLAVGDGRGGLSTWFEVRSRGTSRLRRIHPLQPHAGEVVAIQTGVRNRTLASLDRGGEVHLDYSTTECHLLTLRGEPGAPLVRMGFDGRGEALAAIDSQRRLLVWRIDNPHPEISFRALFGRVQYEGYERPEAAWQTTGGGDFEPKMSLTPLIFGTLKGTFYAMLLAVPLALFGAAYTSHFTTPAFKRAIKPAVETMAAVPSVVIGFLIALWLAPVLQRWILAVFAMLVTLPATFLAFMAVWQVLRRKDWAKRVENGFEFLALIPVVLVGAGIAVAMAGPLESWFFGGNFAAWLNRVLHVRYDHLNCIVIAFGLGFAVIPIIFSIAEDSLSTVPYSLTAASMALGASRWQTLWRVVLPSGSPGIFAGIMIGFGRAVGETMIVLMATGNTPILDFSPFDGMRTLSANIAVELPEAAVDSTHYRVLFLCGVILFLLTFTLNTAAELVRQHLRKRYGRL